MNAEAKSIVRKVLANAATAPHFFDLSETERLNWMIATAYALGKRWRKGKPHRHRDRDDLGLDDSFLREVECEELD